MMNRTSIDEQQRGQKEESKASRRAERMRHDQQEEGKTMDLSRLRELTRNLGGQLEEQARKRPYVALGAAVGVGFVAGSLLGSRLGQALLAAGIGYVAKNLIDGDIGVERLQENIEKLAHERAKG
jgi:ElaB/YqjD/DUF883 family membrane-anchored ribosome-binding protein